MYNACNVCIIIYVYIQHIYILFTDSFHIYQSEIKNGRMEKMEYVCELNSAARAALISFTRSMDKAGIYVHITFFL